MMCLVLLVNMLYFYNQLPNTKESGCVFLLHPGRLCVCYMDGMHGQEYSKFDGSSGDVVLKKNDENILDSLENK